MRRRIGASLRTRLAACTVFLITVLAYRDVLGYWFTGVDTIPLIETSRVFSLEGVLVTFARPLMDGSHFTDRAMFYRPIASLSYAFDYWAWGLDPFGYHLTDLLLHAGTAALVVILVCVVLDDTSTGALAGVIFALHPLAVEVVPTPARRHDMLATAFILVAVALFVRATETMAVGRTDREDFADGDRGRTEERRTASGPSVDRGLRYRHLAGSVLAYLLALGSKETAIVLPALVGAWLVIRWWGGSSRRALRAGVALLGPFAVATVGYLALRIAVLDGLGGYDRSVTVTAEAITTMVSRYVLSLVYPVDFLNALSTYDLQLVPNGLYVVLAGTSLLVVHGVSKRQGVRLALASARGRLLALSGVWIVVPVLLFVRTGRYTVRSGYVAVVPVAIVLAVVVVGAAREVRRRDDPRAVSIAALVVGSMLVISLLAGSPLVHPYDGWERAGEVSKDSLTAVANGTDGLPPGASVEVYDVPHPRSTDQMSSFPQARSVTFVWGNTIRSWLRLQGQPDRRIYTNGTVTLSDAPTDVIVELRPDGNQSALCLRYEPTSVTTDDPTGAGSTGSDAQTVSEIPDDRSERPPCEAISGTHPSIESLGDTDGRVGQSQ